MDLRKGSIDVDATPTVHSLRKRVAMLLGERLVVTSAEVLELVVVGGGHGILDGGDAHVEGSSREGGTPNTESSQQPTSHRVSVALQGLIHPRACSSSTSELKQRGARPANSIEDHQAKPLEYRANQELFSRSATSVGEEDISVEAEDSVATKGLGSKSDLQNLTGQEHDRARTKSVRVGHASTRDDVAKDRSTSVGMAIRASEVTEPMAASIAHTSKGSIRGHHERGSREVVANQEGHLIVEGSSSSNVGRVQSGLVPDVDVIRLASNREGDSNGRVHSSVEESGLGVSAIGPSSTTHHTEEGKVVSVGVAPLGIVSDDIGEVVGHGGEEG